MDTRCQNDSTSEPGTVLVVLGQPAQVLSVQEHKIEGKHHQPVGSALNRCSQGGEVRQAILVLDDDLAINQG